MKQENNAGGRPGLIGRRDLIAMVGGAAVAWPLAARAQERALPLIGFFNGGAADRSTGFLVGIPRGLNEMGFVEGRNFAAEYRWADDHLDRLPALAADLVQRRVAVIVTGGGPQPALAAKAATSTIPIVFFTGDDPVTFGLVPRINRPGSNLTGFNFMISELEQKRVGLLHELVPTAGVVAALCDPHGSGAAAILAEVAGAAKSLGLELVTPASEHVLDWFHITMRLTMLGQYARGVAHHDDAEGTRLLTSLDRIKWLLWHGNQHRALETIGFFEDDVGALEVDYPNLGKFARAAHEFAVYITSNTGSLINYGERYRAGERISSCLAESTVNAVISKRFAKRQQMQWTPRGAHLLLQMRTRALDGALRHLFERWYPGLANDNDARAEQAAA